MGYTTDFDGRINLSRELTDAEAKAIYDFSEERHGGNVGGFTTRVQGYWCNWAPTDDRLGIEWNGAEKFYDADEWMQLVLDEFITPAGIVANGTIKAQGEDYNDRWLLVVTDNVVTTKKGRVVYD